MKRISKPKAKVAPKRGVAARTRSRKPQRAPSAVQKELRETLHTIEESAKELHGKAHELDAQADAVHLSAEEAHVTAAALHSREAPGEDGGSGDR